MTVVPETLTCWTLVARAVEGSDAHRDAFARRDLPLVRAYFARRRHGWPLAHEAGDSLPPSARPCPSTHARERPAPRLS